MVLERQNLWKILKTLLERKIVTGQLVAELQNPDCHPFISNPNIEYLFIDEFESLPKKDQYVLLSAMQDGVISETLYGKTKGRKVKVSVRVFASSNDTRKIDRALLTRFTVVNMNGYTEDQFVKIAFAKCMESIEAETLEFIARAVYKTFHEPTVRDVLRIVNLSKGDEDKILKLITILGVKKLQ